MSAHNIYLIGLMGAGKTTVGGRLARLLRCPFIDTDQELEKRTGVSINYIFEIEGEGGFRERESNLLADIVDRHAGENTRAVISTGGGIILRQSNRSVMHRTGTVVYLRASPELLCKRLKHSRSRPLLSTPDPKSKIAQLLDERGPIYTAEADVIVDVGAQSAAKLADKIGDLLQQNENG